MITITSPHASGGTSIGGSASPGSTRAANTLLSGSPSSVAVTLLTPASAESTSSIDVGGASTLARVQRTDHRAPTGRRRLAASHAATANAAMANTPPITSHPMAATYATRNVGMAA